MLYVDVYVDVDVDIDIDRDINIDIESLHMRKKNILEMICLQSFSILGGLHFSSETGPTSPTNPVFTAQHQVWCRVKVTRYLSPLHLSSLNPAVVLQHGQQQGFLQVMLLTSGMDLTIPWFPSERFDSAYIPGKAEQLSLLRLLCRWLLGKETGSPMAKPIETNSFSTLGGGI